MSFSKPAHQKVSRHLPAWFAYSMGIYIATPQVKLQFMTAFSLCNYYVMLHRQKCASPTWRACSYQLLYPHIFPQSLFCALENREPAFDHKALSYVIATKGLVQACMCVLCRTPKFCCCTRMGLNVMLVCSLSCCQRLYKLLLAYTLARRATLQ